MAELELAADQTHNWGSDVPCMLCGSASSCLVQKTFTWTPQVDGATRISAWASGNPDQRKAVSTWTRVVAIPLCSRHRNYWRRYGWLTAAFLLGDLLLMILFVV